VIAIVGFAVHRNIASLVAGIALYFERGLAIGDRVRVENCGEGVVADIGWRATTLRTDDARMISIPNSILAASVIERGIAAAKS
jgi:small-conductance mechanosensitive channel